LPAGPYLVIPLLGPSNVRDAAGLAGDSAMAVAPWFVDWWILGAGRVAEAVNARALLLEQVEEAKRASFDYYVFVRNAYAQRRNALVNDRAEGSAIDQEELYHPEGTDGQPSGGPTP
jgi:phospholipid-binding lipoprotein MlaA